jgi:sigma-B regulation protein RsbU (phosphoserine phosphatase)
MKVLIAEDDQISAQVLQSFLEKWGHEVVTAETGAEAWLLFQQHDIALVISDWMMPEMDGLELVRRIRACQRPGYVYVILLTARSRKEDIIRGMEAGADDFLVKPFDREELRVRLRAGERMVQLEHSLARRNDELETANAQISAANRRMKRDLEAAARIQHALLPTTLPDTHKVRFAWTFKPCEELAGDILGVVSLDENHVALYVLDVSGHGVAAALSSVSVRHLLSPLSSSASLLRQRLPGSTGFRLVPPAEVAADLNRQFPMDAATGQFFTLLYGILALNTHEFQYVSAGHPAPIHLPRAGPPVALALPGFPIGINPDAVYYDQVLQLGPGDRLYLFSDGIPEAFNDQDKQFGPDRLAATLDQGRSVSLQASLDNLLTTVEQWCSSGHLVDDVSVLAVEIVGDTASSSTD